MKMSDEIMVAQWAEVKASMEEERTSNSVEMEIWMKGWSSEDRDEAKLGNLESSFLVRHQEQSCLLEGTLIIAYQATKEAVRFVGKEQVAQKNNKIVQNSQRFLSLID